MRASESDRAIACPASLVPPRSLYRSPRADASAAWGSLCHSWKETGLVEYPGASEKDLACLEKKLLLSDTRREHYWRPDEGEHEVTFALHLTDLTVLQYADCPDKARTPRDAWKELWDPRVWLTGTIDWLHWGTDDTVPWVDDLKTGDWPVYPGKSAQLRSYALLPWVLRGCEMDWECAISVTQWPRYPLAGRPVRRSHRLSGLDMMEHLDKLRYVTEHPTEVNPWGWDADEKTWAPGDQCTFCPHREIHTASVWMDSHKYRSFPSCARGLVQLITEEESN